MSILLWAVTMERELTAPEQAALWEVLPTERRERLRRVQDKRRHREPLCAYGLLQLALQEAYGWDGLPELIYGSKGKPEFARHPDVQFSISHTGGAALVGLSEKPLGVDVEQIRPLNPRVQQRLAASGETAEQYYENWVRYEAAVKRRGGGVSSHRDPQEGQEAQLVKLLPGYIAAVSGEGQITQLKHVSLNQIFPICAP